MGLSSNTLFQFTASRETLEAILTSKYLWPRYCTEYYWNGFRFALPMTCLCDIPLSSIGEHTDKYGHFGIGLSKKWAEGIKELSSVIYTRTGSALYKEVLSILKKKFNGETLSKSDIFLLSKTKKYSGNTYCGGGNQRRLVRNVRFYDEREWRYVPATLKENEIFVEKSSDKIPIAGDNEGTKGTPSFQYSDIRYLFVKDESERRALLTFIKNQLKNNISEEDMMILMSKVLTIKQIKEDF